jgi:NADPH:quinone reductase-like Zn-dependent oxidoreductase
MQAVLMRETGGPQVLGLEEVERPEPGDGQVLVEVHAASVNPIDWKYRRGLMPKQLPVVLGNDVSGKVVSSRAEGFAEGDEVFGIALSGGYAEFATAPAAAIAIKPAGVSHEQAAALPVAGMTAWQALFDHGGLQAGQTALIAGAAGGVGHLAVQLARRAGASAVGIGSSRNRDFVLGLGAERYIDYTREDVATALSDVDLAFDAVGAEITQSLLATVRTGGVLVTIANAPPEQEAAARGARAVLFSMTPNPGQLSEIGRLVAAGELHVEIAEVFALSRVSRAHELSESGHTRGKIVLRVDR